MRTAAAVLLILCCTVAFAQQDTNSDNRVDVLVPIFVNKVSVSGAYGSEWATEVWFRNDTQGSFAFLQRGLVCLPECNPYYPPGVSTRVLALSNGRGVIFSFHPVSALRVSFSARLLELSRNAQPNGVEMPVVWEDEWLHTESILAGIPQRVDSRIALRVYDPRRAGIAVNVELIDPQGTVIGSRVFRPSEDLPDGGIDLPHYEAINDLVTAFPQLAAVERFDIRMSPLTEGAEYWGFVTVTHRETQHVLLVTPDKSR